MEKEDSDTLKTLQAKSTKGAAFSIKVFNLKKEETCLVCPKKTSKAFALYKKGELLCAIKCDTAFCMLATLTNYFLQQNDQGDSEPVAATWIDHRVQGRIAKAEKSSAQDQAIHQCKEVAESAVALEAIKEEIKKCSARGASACLQEYINILKTANVLEYHSKASEIPENKFKDLVHQGITKSALKCGSCGDHHEASIAITGVSEDCLIGTRYHVHCDKIECLVEILAKNANMTPSANPKLVEQTAAGREHIEEKKARENPFKCQADS